MNANTNTSARTARPLPTEYNKINDLDMSHKRERRRKRFNYTRIIGFICVVLLSIIIVCLYYLLQKDYKCVSNELQKCQKKECILSAALMLNKMKTSFYPCDDFYQFSCGDSLNNEPQNRNNFFNQMHYKLNLDLKNSIESFSDENQPKYIRKVYKYYESCLNEDLIEKRDLEPMSDVIESLGGWPVVKGNQWPNRYKHYHWINTYIMMRKNGLNANSLLTITVEKDIRNTSRYILAIDQPIFDISAENLNNSKHYFDLMVKIAEMMGIDKIDAENDLLQSLIFEKELFQLSLSEEDHRNNTYFNNNYMNVRQMQILAPNINWIQLLTEFLGQPVREDMEVIALVPTYIRKLNQKIVQIEARVLANYMIWKVVYTNLQLMGKRWREPIEKYFLNTIENYKTPNRWQTCLKYIQNYMPLELGNIYMKKHFNTRNEIEVISMIDNIKESFIEILDTNEWMSDEVKAKTKNKTLLMGLRLGFPKELLDESQMDSWVKDVNIEKDFFKNTLTLNLFKVNEKMKNLLNSSNQNLNWEKVVNPADIILKYSPEDNALLISAALINGFYREDLPKYLNYGSLGVLISEQIVRVFDEIGRLYDQNGIHGNWWDKVSDKRFENYKQCFDKQIKDSDDILVKMSERDRIQSTEQLITDNIAFRLAIAGYRAHIKQSGAESGLVGVNHTTEQLFWINTANTFCSFNYENQIWNSFERTKYRINSLVSNIKEFSEAFDCTPESAMNSPIKC